MASSRSVVRTISSPSVDVCFLCSKNLISCDSCDTLLEIQGIPNSAEGKLNILKVTCQLLRVQWPSIQSPFLENALPFCLPCLKNVVQIVILREQLFSIESDIRKKLGELEASVAVSMETENFGEIHFFGEEHFEHPTSLAHCRQIFQKQVYSECLDKKLLRLKSEQHSLSTGEQKAELNCSLVQLQLQKSVFQVAQCHRTESCNDVKMMTNSQEQQTHYSFGPCHDIEISCKMEAPVEDEFAFCLIEAEKEKNDVSDDSDYGSPSKKFKEAQPIPEMKKSIFSAKNTMNVEISESDDESNSGSDETRIEKDSDDSETGSDGSDDTDDSDVPPVLEPSVSIATDTDKLSKFEGKEGKAEKCTVLIKKEKTYKAKDGSVWSTEPFKSTFPKSRARPSEALVGPARDPKLTEVQLFKMMFTPSMVDTIVKYSNKYGENDFQNSKSSWKPITKDEIYACIGILLYLGAEKKRHVAIREAWSLDPRYIMPSIVATMSRKRFHLITRYLRFDDDESRKNLPKNESKLGYISEIFDPFVRNIESHFVPKSNIVVGEMLDKHINTLRYKKSERNWRDLMKVWGVHDAETGYVLRLCVYEGKIRNANATDLGKKAVLGLVEKYTGSGLTVTTDNFFTSKSLGTELLKRNMRLLGSLHKRRMDVIPEFAEGKGRESQSSMFAFQKPFTMVSYVPKKDRPVLILSTAHNSTKINLEAKQKPQLILDYNASKSGVDAADAMIANYSCQRAAKRWQMKLFNAMCDISALNAFIIWKSHRKNQHKTGESSMRRDFLLKLAQHLMEPVIMARNLNGRTNGLIPPVDNAIKLMLKVFGSADVDEPISEPISEPVGSGDKSKCVKVTWPFADHQKMGMCRYCPGKSRRKKISRSRCPSCGKWICGDHMTIIRHCPKCPYLPFGGTEHPMPIVKPTPEPPSLHVPTILMGIQSIPDMNQY